MTQALGDVELLKEQDHDSWDAYVRNCDRATLFHSTRWKAAIEATYGHRGYYLLVKKEGGQIAGILPLFLVGSRLLGRALFALPFAGTQPSVCADDRCGENGLVARAATLAQELGAGYVELREDDEKPWDFPVRHSYVNVRLPLSADPEALWRERVDTRVRTKVRAARKRGLRVEWAHGDAAVVEAFFRIYAETMHRLGSPPHSKALFHNVAEVFAGESQIVLVMDGDDPVAGAFVMHEARWVGFPWAASLTQASVKHPNNLLYWAIIEWACKRGYKFLDLGRSPAGSGPAHFKTQWGGVTRPLSYYYVLTGASKPPTRDATDPAMVLASKIWGRLPQRVSNWAGPSLARLIP